MTTYNMKADIRAGIHKVWEIVSAAEGYPAWRSDVEKTVTAHEKQFTT